MLPDPSEAHTTRCEVRMAFTNSFVLGMGRPSSTSINTLTCGYYAYSPDNATEHQVLCLGK